MQCKNCGKVLNEGELFCTNCGTKVENETNLNLENNVIQNSKLETITNINQNQENGQLSNKPTTLATDFNVYNQNSMQMINPENNASQNSKLETITNINTLNNNINENKSSTWKNTTSLVIGIISLVLVFIFQIFTMPLSFTGIIFGILSVKNNKKHKIGLILSIISFVIAIPIFFLYDSILNTQPLNPTVGTWDCKAFNNGDNEHLDYVITMKLNNNDEFKWNKYNDEENNYIIGTYEFEDLHKTNNNGSANYYSLKLTGEEFVNEGVLQTEAYKSEYEMGIINGKDEAILMNVYSYNLYYCYRSDDSVPKIK